MLTVGDQFPAYVVKACTSNEPEGLKTATQKCEACQGKWKLYVFYPKDFTFVCPTELVEFGKRLADFKERHVQLIGGSTDNEYCHLAWRNSHPELKTLPFPLIAAQKLAVDLGILHPEANVCLRATFLVDDEGIIRHVTVNDLSVGRNVDEMLRVIDATQSGALIPCNWQPGEAPIEV